MTLVAGTLPTDASQARSAGGYAPGYGVLPIQLGTPSGDTTQGAGGQLSAPQVVQVASGQSIANASPYPLGATPITAASGNVAAATAAATLAATSGKTTYITGFAVTGTGATAALAVSVTVTGVITGTMTFTYAAVAGVAVENTPLIVQFPYPIPASTTNTTIVVSCPTLGSGNTNNTVNAYGFQL